MGEKNWLYLFSGKGSERCHSAQTFQPVNRQQEKGRRGERLCAHGPADRAVPEANPHPLPYAQS